jgi:hypothetical protein
MEFLVAYAEKSESKSNIICLKIICTALKRIVKIKKYVFFLICTSLSFSLNQWIYCGAVNSGSTRMEWTITTRVRTSDPTVLYMVSVIVSTPTFVKTVFVFSLLRPFTFSQDALLRASLLRPLEH